jgi:hypothetical protein
MRLERVARRPAPAPTTPASAARREGRGLEAGLIAGLALAALLDERRGLWVSPTQAGMVAIDGLLDPEAGATLLVALEPLARPTSAEDQRSGSQRRADALAELARRLEGGRLPNTGGVRPQLTVTVELASLLGHTGLLGGDGGPTGPLPAETCRRLACDATLTRVLVTRHQAGQASGHDADHPDPHHHPLTAGDGGSATSGLAARLRAAATLLPPALGGAPTQPLEVGRATRVVSAAPTHRAGGP